MSDSPKFVTAKENLYVGHGVLAHVKGDAVPVENVEPNGWGDLVTGRAVTAETIESAPKGK